MLCARDPPTESEYVPRAETSLLGPPREETAGIGLLSCSWYQCCQLNKVTSIQRKLRDLCRT